jgi:hypothetical protein
LSGRPLQHEVGRREGVIGDDVDGEIGDAVAIGVGIDHLHRAGLDDPQFPGMAGEGSGAEAEGGVAVAAVAVRVPAPP